MEIIKKYFPDINDQQLEKFSQLGELYQYWNQRINVISRKDIDELYERHVLHSLAISKIIQFKDGTKILDVGTGGGFPGIPLAILFPNVKFTLIDSIGKKIKVVNSVSEAIGLKNVEGIHTRVQDLKQQYDFVISRAVTNLPDFFTWIKGKVHGKSENDLKNGVIYLKGGDFDHELLEINKDFKVFSIDDWFEESFFETKKVVYVN